MSIAYDRALLAKQCEDIIKTAERVRDNLPWFDFFTELRLNRLIDLATRTMEDFTEE